MNLGEILDNFQQSMHESFGFSEKNSIMLSTLIHQTGEKWALNEFGRNLDNFQQSMPESFGFSFLSFFHMI